MMRSGRIAGRGRKLARLYHGWTPWLLIPQKLPWPESVQVGIDKLLESKMFETSQVGIDGLGPGG